MLFVFVRHMKVHRNAILVLLAAGLLSGWQAPEHSNASSAAPLGFRDFSRQEQIEKQFLQVPDPKLAREHLRTLTSAPHIAGSPEDRATADYVATKFREAGLDTQIVEYRVWMNRPAEISVNSWPYSSMVTRSTDAEGVLWSVVTCLVLELGKTDV